ncbi:hypothetical protein GCM10025876_26060 [Demequina litorisediminis]|uniref:Uncharacterized protein n=1 Tax=Demequina litorisediminis TaxID=1849022 RepID=A0ABQ6IET2_9MICO|nr:hypothetical protein GCM10025876_26060 [Demequina litorisediminis]
MRIVSVNVNGVRAALRKGMLPWLDEVGADVVCLQEVRAPEDLLVAEPGHHLERGRPHQRAEGPQWRRDPFPRHAH